MMDKTIIFSEIEKLESDMVRELCRIVRFPAVSPHNGGLGEEAKAQEVAKIIEEMGLLQNGKLEWVRIPDEKSPTGNRPSLILHTEGERPERLWMFSHLDIVSEGDRSKWNTDPFEPLVKDGRIYGRGTNDNGQSGIAMLHALKALKKLGIKPAYHICLAFVADEEMGSRFSIEQMVKHGFFRPTDLMIVPDGGDSSGDFIEIAEKGMLQMEFTVNGKQVHASSPELGINACRAANIFSVELDEALHKAFPDRNELFAPQSSTFEPTRRFTNVVSVNVVPGYEKLAFDCRILPHIKLDDVIDVANKVVKDIEMRTGAKIDLDVINRHDPAPATSQDAPVVKLLVKALDAVLGVKPRFGGIGGGTFAAFFRHEGIPAIVWEQNTDGTAHQPNEYSEIKYMVNDAKVFALMMAGY